MSTHSELSEVIKVRRSEIKTQSGPITIRYINPIDKNPDTLKSIIDNSPHLSQLSKLFDEKIHNKIILICDDLNFGISAIGKIGKSMTGFLEKSSALETDIDFDDDMFSFNDRFDDFNYKEDKDDISEDFIIVFESKFDSNCNNVGETSILEKVNPQAPMLDYSEFANVIFVTDGLFTLTEKSIDFLQSFQGNIAVVSSSRNKNMSSIDQLSFESDFEVFQIQNPSLDFLVQQFKALATSKGYTINEKLSIENAITDLMNFRKRNFGEYDLSIYLDKTIKANNHKSKEIKFFPPLNKINKEITSQVLMDNIVGLEDIKESIFKALYKNIHIREMTKKGNQVLENYKHIAFEGNPGTCKTTMARAVANLYLENNIVSNGFYEYGREDIVGRYLGETSQKISKIFKMGQGGVIFIDEIGSLLTGNSIDSYGEEALNTIIRNMENDPETMVIIATYPNEMEKLMSINPGLKSRLSDVIRFPDYCNKQLLEIFKSITFGSGYSLENGFEDIIDKYFDKIKSDENFGNGREARKLFENSISQLSVELFKNKSKNIDIITNSAITKAVSYLSMNIKSNVNHQIGFTIKK